MKKRAIIIGFGGMGKRHYLALKKMNINVIAICDNKINKFKKNNLPKDILFHKNYKKTIKLNADLLCVASNTKSRFKIIRDFILNSNIKKIITEKPLSTSLYNSRALMKLAKKFKVRFIINTHRTFSPNFMNVKKIFKKYNEKPTSIFINSPSAGLGNMGSTFFDLGSFFFNTKAKSVISWIDKKNTPNPRGKEFIDPGGYGIINYKGKKKLFFDLSEDTSLPYIITIKSKSLEFVIDEINNKFQLKRRPKKMANKPLYYYLYKPDHIKIKLKHKFDVANMTVFSIKELFKKRFSYKNLNNSHEVMECIFACHISSKTKKIVTLPINNKYSKLNLNFA
tara:strand:+ start:4394 stop:5407 length:1014 start_codon:yes stop_codon:yes gene_type:complete